MADEGRQRRVAERIRASVTQTLDRKVKDPRLGFVTITDVRVTGDLQHATIYYTVMGDDKDKRATRRALESAKGLIRSEVGAALGLRLTPTITFEPDPLPDSAASIEDALRQAKTRDEAIRKSAEGKTFAGEEDPYKVTRARIDEDDEGAVDSLQEVAQVSADGGDPNALEDGSLEDFDGKDAKLSDKKLEHNVVENWSIDQDRLEFKSDEA